jgi:hypothetical protein
MPTSELKKGALVERTQPSAGRRPATLSPVEAELKQVALCPDDVPWGGGREVYLQSRLLKRTVLVARAQTALWPINS